MPTYRLYQWVWQGVDRLFPPLCAGCGEKGERWCMACQQKTTQIKDAICECCGRLLKQGGLCVVCQRARPSYLAARAWGVYQGPLQQAVHRLKYRRDLGLGEILAQPMAALARQLAWPIDVVVPVPLGRQRLRSRGYNQAAVLAWPLATLLGVDYHPKVVQRIRETRSQVGLSVNERHQNVADAFQANASVVAAAGVLLVDDVMTTGATLNATAGALLQAGAGQVYALTLARVA